jgi:hypothetical protein
MALRKLLSQFVALFAFFIPSNSIACGNFFFGLN